MQALAFRGLKRILCVGAHADDIEIGCGGTLLTLLRTYPRLEVSWVVFSAAGARVGEARRSARAYLGAARGSRVAIHDFRESFFPSQSEQIKERFETLKGFRPDLVLTHYREDRHQDHRLLSDLTWNTFRSHAILEYEIPKYDGDLGQPNAFVAVAEAVLRRKVALLMRHFRTQAGRHWFTPDLFTALPRLRGVECDSPSRFAEAFYARKVVLAGPGRAAGPRRQ